ncbi:substrate-binding domain-containing protein [Accumulibacter sp.]|uniref:substrate-binding domain-containing protein n=1 Tax=Accumulibacter sp. TaxID=2053492 RepID=UPI0025DF57CD|nr:substrate-binding domain-containing protein [Accumulibacter sp.]MCM8612613.1 substrate-binding domain-containing protein [Accumulibacter sp.]MCM8636125.1 substrate-binding domain-containing protein [Accumulibacter sp.]MCM8639931.1 substrate-binding domain-containing protein [Accumulibacter sp.]
MDRRSLRLLLPLHLGCLLSGSWLPVLAADVLRLATTTSTDNSGLLRAILPQFERQHGMRGHVIAVGSGKALKLAQNGDVDVVLVHDRRADDAFVAAGYGVERRDVMYNDFVLLGPRSDPAGVGRSGDVLDALRRIADSQTRFASRGDDSGTDRVEESYWQLLAMPASGRPWYISAGLGMGEVLMMAGEMQASTLSDRATHATYSGRTGLEIVFQGDRRMFNPYGVIAVNPRNHPLVNHAGALALIDWLTGPAGRSAISAFRPQGEQLFFVAAGNCGAPLGTPGSHPVRLAAARLW